MNQETFGAEYLESSDVAIVGGRWIRYEDGTMYNTETGIWKMW